MNKKGLMLPILAILNSTLVFAESKNLGEKFYEWFGFIAKINWTTVNFGEASQAVFFAKFLMWVLVFTVLYYSARTYVFKEPKQNKYAVVISLVISLITILGVKGTTIQQIYQTYSAIVIIFFIGGPILGVYLFTRNLHEELKVSDRVHHIIDAILYWVILVALRAVNEGLKYNWNLFNYEQWMGFAFAICELLLVYHIFMAIFGEGWWDLGPGPTFSLGRTREEREEEAQRPAGPIPGPTRTTPKRDDPVTPRVPPSGIIPGRPSFRPSIYPKQPKLPDTRIFKDLSPDFKGIRSQGSTCACTAFATTSIFEYVLNQLKLGDRYLSPQYLWYKGRERHNRVNQNIGLYAYESETNLKNFGVCLESLWPFTDLAGTKWRENPSAQATNDAQKRKLGEFFTVDKDDPDQWAHQIISDNPLGIGVRVPTDWGPGYSKKFYDNPNPASGGAHAMVITGYHSHYPYQGRGVKAFKIRNSWGVTWGENGYTWVPAATLKNLMLDNPTILAGWKTQEIDKTFTITGRVVWDPSVGKNSYKKTGKQIYDDGKIDSPSQAKVLAWVAHRGKLKLLEAVEADKKGKFIMQFELKPKRTAINVKDIPQLAIIQGFDKLEDGKVIVTSEADGLVGCHVVGFIEGGYGSLAGRGGLGIEHPDQPCTSEVQKNIPFSGLPIIFTDKHKQEQYVIIPLKKDKAKEEAEEEKVKGMVEDLQAWVGAQNAKLGDVYVLVKKGEYEKASNLFHRIVGSSERRTDRYKKKLIKEIEENYPDVKEKINFKDFTRMLDWLIASSGRGGTIDKLLEKGSDKNQKELLKSLDKVIAWTAGIQGVLNKLKK